MLLRNCIARQSSHQQPWTFRRPGKSLFSCLEYNISPCFRQEPSLDCTPKKVPVENKEKYYIPSRKKAIFQGGEKSKVADVSFVAQCNYAKALNKQFIRVVSCNTTGLCRTLNPIKEKYGIEIG